MEYEYFSAIVCITSESMESYFYKKTEINETFYKYISSN